MTLEFDGKQISMCNTADAYFYSIDRIHKLFHILLQNFAYDKSALWPSNIDDDFRDDCVSCGFISHNLASIENLGAQFLAHLTENGLIKLSGNRKHVIQTSSTKKWLRKADKLMHYILFAIHLGYGQPACTTELATLTYNNFPNFYNGLFVSKAKGAMCLSSLYWKSQQQQQHSRQVLRFVDPMLSQIQCMFLAIIRHADYAICQSNPGISSEQSHQKLKSVYLHYLFVHSGTWIQGQDIREIFQCLWKKASTVDITYQEYRHISRCFVINLTNKESQQAGTYFQDTMDVSCVEDPDDDNAMDFFNQSPQVDQSQELLNNTFHQWEAIDEQAGHSHHTADPIYGKLVESMIFVSGQLESKT
ncbi:hypothetical protein H4R20_001873, partial [Coemansia guatemalensis]